MELGFPFFFTNLMLGVGLAMDAFSVSLANGLHDPKMKSRKVLAIAILFAVFQGLMPLIGWVCIHTIVQYFRAFEKLIPWIALILLGYIGVNMLRDGICECKEGSDCHCQELTLSALLLQGVATSIDALSVGFTIADYNFGAALLAVLLIAVVTFVICLAGVIIGKKVGNKISGKAGILGGVILIYIGLQIFVQSWL